MASAVQNLPASFHSLPDATRSYLGSIQKQFTLSDEKLLAITQRFIDDFAAGLSDYGKPMAMMYVTALVDWWHN